MRWWSAAASSTSASEPVPRSAVWVAARHAHVRADRGDELGIEPVGAFGYVRLFAPCFRAGGRQVAVPVVKAHVYAAEELKEA